MARVFVYDGREFPDPDQKLSNDEVRQHMATYFPELSNAETKDLGERKVKDSEEKEHLWEFKKRVGTKGVGSGIDHKVDTRLVGTLCWLGYCAVKVSLYSGGEEGVKEKIEKGVCPICGGKLRARKEQ